MYFFLGGNELFVFFGSGLFGMMFLLENAVFVGVEQLKSFVFGF